MIKTAVETLNGELTLMVANAGICQIRDALDLTPDDIRLVFDVNFLGTFNCYTLAAKQMIAQQAKAQESGANDSTTTAWKYRIIGASSIVAFRPFALSIHYSAAKWAVRGFTQGFAMEMAKHKIAVNAYAPGVVATEMWSKIDGDLQSVAGTSPGQASSEGAERALMQRLATAEDVANVVAGFLAGPDASFVNGQTIVIDGGVILT
jgi:NAD(P)-dependent dehydrogenase (short-subunit alcohol dehydrogenase family)